MVRSRALTALLGALLLAGLISTLSTLASAHEAAQEEAKHSRRAAIQSTTGLESLSNQIAFLNPDTSDVQDVDSVLDLFEASHSGQSHHGSHHGKIFLIRHGEKVKHDKTGLSWKGKQRAKCFRRKFTKGKNEVGYLLSQDYMSDGRRKRPFWTLEPLARKLGLQIDHHCDRDDAHCAARTALKQASLGHNVLICWEHKRLADIAEALGVRGVEYPDDRFDVMYTLQLEQDDLRRGFKLKSVESEQCDGLDKKWKKWKAGKHRGGGLGKDANWPVTVDG